MAITQTASSAELRISGTLTLAAATPQNIDIVMGGRRELSLLIKNTGGSNALDSVAVYVSPLGTLFALCAAYGSAIGSTAANTVAPAVLVSEGPQATIRLTLSSTSGTTVAIEARAR